MSTLLSIWERWPSTQPPKGWTGWGQWTWSWHCLPTALCPACLCSFFLSAWLLWADVIWWCQAREQTACSGMCSRFDFLIFKMPKAWVRDYCFIKANKALKVAFPSKTQLSECTLGRSVHLPEKFSLRDVFLPSEGSGGAQNSASLHTLCTAAHSPRVLETSVMWKPVTKVIANYLNS